MMRRMFRRNESILYKRPSSKSGKMIISMFSNSAPIKVWERNEWWADDWDALDFGRDYDFFRTFFDQFKELMLEVPFAGRAVVSPINSDYTNWNSYLKDCYLVIGASNSENCYYSRNISNVKDSYDSGNITNGEVYYESFFNKKCYKALFSSYCDNSQNIFFCKNCVGVNDCFGCVGLRNKSYYIFNRPYSKDDYQNFINGLNLGSFGSIKKLKEKIEKFWSEFPVKNMHGRQNINVTGDNIYQSKNIKNSFIIEESENLKYCFEILFNGGAKDSMDYHRYGLGSELMYECIVCGDKAYKSKFCSNCYPSPRELSYCLTCASSANCFGCIGLRNKQYCILNKQYTKEEYEELVPKIIKHMEDVPYVDKKGRVYKYGEFFPAELSPLAYNETVVQEYFPLTKEQAIEKGYSWKDPEERNINITIKSEDLPDHIKDVDDSILKQIIECQHKGTCNEQCTTAFKIIEAELEFYRKMNLPLPRFCPNCRHYQRIKQRNPIKLWKRTCQCAGTKSENGIYQNTIVHAHGENPCPNEFETTYAPERQEIVYCEQCYQAEVV